MLTPLLVLAATLVITGAVVIDYIRARRFYEALENTIATPSQLDSAIAKLRLARRGQLERQMRGGGHWPLILIVAAALLLLTALVYDHYRHPWIVTLFLPGIGSVAGARASRIRVARRELEKLDRDERAMPAA